ncbi:ATP-binding protein [Aestuariibius sp. 2305UL40-4]|uniref:sensor histidine kinase NtrY-like n=1 Tax=Aestuariibius violaceus TaxID=3234132 RepID=UPI00345E899E
MRQVSQLRRNRGVQTAFTLGLVLLGPVLALATFTVLSPLDQGTSDTALRLVLLADLTYILVIFALVMQRMARIVAARRARSAGSRLHLRLTGVFALIALIPTVLVAIFAVLTVNFGLEGWFSERVSNAIAASRAAAVAYEEEQRSGLAEDAAAFAGGLNTARLRFGPMDDGRLRQALGEIQEQVQRGLSEAFVINAAGEVRARGDGSYLFYYERPTPAQFERARTENGLIIEDWDNNEFRALVPLRGFTDHYLYVTREVEGSLLELLDETQEIVALYDQLESDRGRLLLDFGLLYLGFAGLLILAATWLGLWFAERLSRPVGRLASAAERVGEGKLDVRVREEEGDDEIAMLGRLFNRMTTQLKAQRAELLANTAQIEQRRRLFDSVLSSVTSGVVGLDPKGRVTFANRSAERLLGVSEAQEAMMLAKAVPEFAALFDQVRKRGTEVAQGQVKLTRARMQETLLVRMAKRRSQDGKLEGYVVAFDDVTDLVSAQRMAAWGDVARRIAHEIKNPLTPIQLSAERIKRKFHDAVGEDADKLDQMTDVIVRQTNDLRRIVDEFSKFARMPEPDRAPTDLVTLVRDAASLQEAGQPDVAFTIDLPDGPMTLDLDETMITQALTNLIKNAGEAIETLQKKGAPDGHSPAIRITLTDAPDAALLWIEDNGIGLPADRARLFEPYVTTRDEGTGLGLPIVRKIIEEHGGQLTLHDADPFGGAIHPGARAEIRLPRANAIETEQNKEM